MSTQMPTLISRNRGGVERTLITVCMATYNGERYLREQIDSILNQEFKENSDLELELVISDDNSTDNTLRIIESYHDSRIRVVSHKNTKKYRYYNSVFACAANFGNAIAHARGEYIFLSDQDDVWYPWKIDRSVSVLRENGGGVVAAAFDMGDGELNKTGEVKYVRQRFFRLKHVGYYGFSIGFDKNELKYIQPFPKAIIHDTFITLIGIRRHRIHLLNEVCAIHRWTGIHNVSSIGVSNPTPQLVRLYYRMRMWIIIMWRGWSRS